MARSSSVPSSFARPASLLFAIALSYLAGGALEQTGWTEPGIDLASIAALAAAVAGLAAVLRVPGTIPVVVLALGVGLAIGHFGGHDLAGRRGDPQGLAALAVAARRLLADATFGTGGINTAAYSLLAVAVGGFCSWEAVRLRRPILALAPVAIAFGVGILNSPGDHLLAALGFVGLVLGLWQAGAGTRLGISAGSAELLVTTAAQRGIVRTATFIALAVVALAGLAPPLSTRDSSAILDSSLNRFRTSLGGSGAGIDVGFSLDAPLSGSLSNSNSQDVLTYRYDGVSPTAAPLYLRGVNLTETALGQWRLQSGQFARLLPPTTPVAYQDVYEEQASITVHVRVLAPPAAAPALLFHPGRLTAADTGLTLRAAESRRADRNGAISSVDEATLLTSPASSYSVQALVSTATEAQLEGAGTLYPSWLAQYSFLGGSGGFYRPLPVLGRVRALAHKVTAGATSPYARAKAVETYLRANYSYTLTPRSTPPGADPIDFFLFTSKQGYCQFFATAMGDMLRSLGIPTRLVNGFGPGSPSGPGGDYAVSSADAHTWVEAYFPRYGWIPFEPTPQIGFDPITRGAPAAATTPEPAAADPSPAATAVPIPTADGNRAQSPGAQRRGGGFSLPVGLLAALVAVVALTWVLRFVWQARDIAGAWRRIQLLSAIAGVEGRLSDTPREFGLRLARVHPDLAPMLIPMAEAYAESAYSRPGGEDRGQLVIDGWRAIAPLLVKRALHRLARLA